MISKNVTENYIKVITKGISGPDDMINREIKIEPKEGFDDKNYVFNRVDENGLDEYVHIDEIERYNVKEK